MRLGVVTLAGILVLSFFIIAPGQSSILSVSSVSIEPIGYEDPSTHEWKGSFWTITATTDTLESYLFYEFNETQSGSFGQDRIGNKTIVPEATIKITITPGRPFWERPLEDKSYLVYPKTYGTWENKISTEVGKISDEYVDPLYASVSEFSGGYWTQHTPFNVTVEKIGDKAFIQTIAVDTVGGTQAFVVSNPADAAEKLMINDLGKLTTGYGEPSVGNIMIFSKEIVFTKTDQLVMDITYARTNDTGDAYNDFSYAFYWFGGGGQFTDRRHGCPIQCWSDDKSPAHYYTWMTNTLLDDYEYPGSRRHDETLNYHVVPIAADIFNNNTDTDPSGLSLVNYLIERRSAQKVLLDVWDQGWEITKDNKLRIYMPRGAASSLITMRISTELADSMVYQPIVGNGKFQQGFWNSTKTSETSIRDKDVAMLDVKQLSTASSKLTVTPSVPPNIPLSVNPLKDSEVVNSNDVHSFKFEVTNSGTTTKQSSSITFTAENDLGTVTDTITLNFELEPTQSSPPQSPPLQPSEDNEADQTSDSMQEYSGDPQFFVLVAVIGGTVLTAVAYSLRSRLAQRKGKNLVIPS